MPVSCRPSNESLVSDPVRPESAGRSALLELETVIRHVTEQLAGYRRRALSAEAQVKEMEIATSRAADLARSAEAAKARVGALERALAEAEASTAAAVEASAVAAARAAALEAARDSARGGAPSEADAAALAAENRALRERLEEAAGRTRQISERVRFLRQQIGNGGEK